MKRNLARSPLSAFLVLGILIFPINSGAQQANSDQLDVSSVVGSVLLSILHVPLKLVTCVGSQVGSAVVYTATFGVAGNYGGGTNGKEIGEVARRSCTGTWVITPEQVSKDYR